MSPITRVAAPPAKPLMVFDGDCRFCGLWIKRWQQITGYSVEYQPYQDADIAARFPEIPREQFATAVQLIGLDGSVYGGARATFGALARNPAWRWPLRIYERSAAFASVAEGGYRFVARHRPLFSVLTCLGWGKHVERPDHFLVRSAFLRSLAVIYLIAFVSLWTQIDGLVGSKGILPAEQFMSGVAEQVKANGIGLDHYRLLPTLCWFSASDSFLHWQCAAGVALAVLLMIGVAPAPCLFLLWVIYLSLSTVCREFLSFQWDILLLEVGFLAIFFAPWQFWPQRARETPPSRVVLWLLRLLLFKLLFQSGCVKLVSGDSMWHNLTALSVHYETQPLPTWIGWYAHQLPLWLQKFFCVTMFGLELVVPFLIFAPRRPRIFAAVLIAILQVLILLTGNYTFFNWLTLALCITLLDDFVLNRVFLFRSRRRKEAEKSEIEPVRLLTLSAASRWRRVVTIPLATVVIAITCLQLFATFCVRPALLQPVAATYQWLAPFRSLNSYGLFAVMTPTRPEIIVEGSNDGVTWLPYEFKYKPGDLKRRPAFVAPHQPRLDWQMWFAALGRWQDNPWFGNFCLRLLQGSPEVLALLEKNPFPNRPPRYIRATAYDYRFTSVAERRQTGNWWRRDPPARIPAGGLVALIWRPRLECPELNRTCPVPLPSRQLILLRYWCGLDKARVPLFLSRMRMILALAGCFALMIVPLSAQEPSDTPAVDGQALTNAPATTEGGTNEVDIKELMALPSFTNDTGMVMVKNSESFWVGAYEVTQEEYQKIAGSNPSKFAGGRNPVDSVSWTDAIAFCAKLTEVEAKAKLLPEGMAYTLPTQDQWEGFAQGAELKDAVTSEKASRTGTAPVGSLGATPPGIYDIRGNVWEWCLDSQNPASRVGRGGAWNSWIDINLRRDFRWYGSPTDHKDSTGFRCVLAPKSGI